MNPLKPLLLLALGLGGWTSAQEFTPSVHLVDTTPTHRVIEHALGTAVIPSKPQRIVALSEDIIDPLLALGVTPVAAGTSLGDAFAPYYADELGGVPPVGQFWEPNLEAVLSAQPDLILDWGRTEKPLYDQLSKIAPVVLVGTDRDARATLLDLGTVLGIEAEAQGRIARYERSIEAARARLEGAVGNQSVLLLEVSNRDLYLYGTDDVYIGSILYDLLGLTPAPVVGRLEMESWGGLTFSLELVPELDAEHIFLLNGRPGVETDERLAELTSSPLWQNLPAVEAGNVYPVQRDGWLSAAVLANEHKIEDIVSALVP